MPLLGLLCFIIAYLIGGWPAVFIWAGINLAFLIIGSILGRDY